MAAERSVHSRWDGDLRAVVRAGDHELIVDEPESVAGGTNRGPQPTELLLASVASCFTLAIAWSARKRGLQIDDVHVDVTGTYDGPQFSAIRIAVRAGAPAGPDLARLVESARRVCYVTRTLSLGPELTVTVQGAGGDDT
ncbi:MAG: OsmC family protein [Pseudonocardia sp.]